MPRRCDFCSLELRQRPDVRAILALYEHIARAVIGPRVQQLARQFFIIGDEVGSHGLTENQVALVFEKLAYGRLMLHVEPFDPSA